MADILFTGYVDFMSTDTIVGWVVDQHDHFRSLGVELVIDGAVVQDALADRPRDDLLVAGFASSEHGFTFTLDETPEPGQAVEVRIAGTGQALQWLVPVVTAAVHDTSGFVPPVPRSPGEVEAMLTLALLPTAAAGSLERLASPATALSGGNGLLAAMLEQAVRSRSGTRDA